MATILKRNQKENRFELVIDGTLTGYTQGENEQEHQKGAKTLKEMAEQKGHEVHLIGVKLDD
jgi:putative N-acetylmannosamine-6-phosphate epimerase